MFYAINCIIFLGKMSSQLVRISEDIPSELEFDVVRHAPGWSATYGNFDTSTGIWSLGAEAEQDDAVIYTDTLTLFFVVGSRESCNRRVIKNCARVLSVGDNAVRNNKYFHNERLESCESIRFDVKEPPKHDESSSSSSSDRSDDSDSQHHDDEDDCQNYFGCDNVYGSCKKFDKCGVCGGIEDRCAIVHTNLTDDETVLQHTECSINFDSETGKYNFHLGKQSHVAAPHTLLIILFCFFLFIVMQRYNITCCDATV
jgi:hypothetical protein